MIANDKAPWRNSEGYKDPTMHMALQKTENDDTRISKLIHLLKDIIDQADYDLLARIELRDRRTGKEYR